MTIRPERGASVRVKIPGVNGVAGYLITKAQGTYYVQGNLWVSLKDTYPRPLKDVEIIPQPASGDPAGSNTGAQQSSPYPGWSGTPLRDGGDFDCRELFLLMERLRQDLLFGFGAIDPMLMLGEEE